ncbi:MAG: rhomboid family intramembrane serine protease [Candidatus Acidiferrales bacterium]|jgi:membrane associated rhomboid family serine protease
MFIPLKDLNPRRTFPFVNILLIATNVLVFIYQVSLQPHAEKVMVYTYALIPARVPMVFAGRLPLAAGFEPLLTSMFLHAGILHLAGNMLFLWIFGDNVEDFFGHLPYLFFYLFCGIGAGLAHTLTNLSSSLPTVGASGAISGVMGAYMVLYPRSSVLTLVLVFPVPIPAVIILGWWFLLQFLGGIGSVGMQAAGGVAWWAHIGGFLMGALIVAIVRRR